MAMASRNKSDMELEVLRNARILWVLRDSLAGFVTHAGSLKGALKKAAMLRAGGEVISSIENESDGIVIDSAQISRLARLEPFSADRFGSASRRGSL